MNFKMLYKKLVAFSLMFMFVPLGFDMWDNPDKYEIQGDFILEV